MQKETANYFLFHATEFPGAMVSVTDVTVTPDLAEARLYVSIFPADKRKGTLALINQKNKDIRYAIGKEMRHQLRIIPALNFMLDESLDRAERINELLEKAKRPHSTDPQPPTEDQQ